MKALGAASRGALNLAHLVQELQRGVDRIPSCPLYQYKLDDGLLADLESLLAARLRESAMSLNRAESAAFVLYCAHQFAKTYTGGHWTWSIAKATVDPENRLAPPLLYDVVDRGLRAWGRSVYWNGRNHEYLYTVGREGGLPLGVLAHEREEGLRNFLQRLLTRIETSTVSAEEAAGDLEHYLPTQLQQPEILRLAADLVRGVAELRAQVPEDTKSPSLWLDEHLDGWRDHLPLRTNDDVASALISGLVQQARPKAREQGFAVVTRLVNGRLQRTLQTPRRLAPQDLVAAGADSTLPVRLRLAVSNGRLQSARAMATRVGDDEYIVERLSAEPLQGAAWFTEELRLVVGVGERELASHPLFGGEVEGDAALPWVFDADTDGGWRLMARGSYASPSESLMIAYRPDAGALKVQSGSLEAAGEDPVLGRSFVCLHGVAQWVSEQDVCEIASGSETQSARFELKGVSELLAGTGSFIWRGPPQVWTHGPQRGAARVPEHRLEWRAMGSKRPWQSGAHAALGDVELRVRDEHHTLYRARLTVVPRDFRVELSTSRATAGTVRVRSAQVSGGRVLSRGVEASTRTVSGGMAIDVSCAVPPADLELEVQLGASARLILRVPFPCEFCGFVSVEGSVLLNLGRIGVDVLTRWMARAVSCDSAQRFVLEAHTDQGVRAIAELPQSSPGIAELPLARVRAALEACLAGTRRIDAFIPLRVSRHTGIITGAAARTEARLGWHEAQLEVDLAAEPPAIQLGQALIDQLDDWQVTDFRVLARPLHAPAAEPLTLAGNARDGWVLSPPGERLWLLTGWVGNALMTRPRLVQLENVESTDRVIASSSPADLDTAMRLPTLEARREALAAVYHSLSTDYGRDDWNRVDDFLKTLHELPPPTYDVVCALAAAKPAAVVALFRQPSIHFTPVWDGLEQLGISWHTIPIGVWLRAARLGHDFAFNSPHADLFGGKEPFSRCVMPGLFEQVKAGPRFFSILLAALHGYCEGFAADPQGSPCLQLARTAPGRKMLRQHVRDACCELRRRAEMTGDRFPPVRVSGHDCCPDIQALLESFGLADQAAYTWECLAAPLVAAQVMIEGADVTASFLDDLRLLRSFDDEWFEFAHAAALTVLLGKKLELDDEFCEHAESEVLRADG